MDEEGHGVSRDIQLVSRGETDTVPGRSEASTLHLPLVVEPATGCELQHVAAVHDDLAGLLVHLVGVALTVDDDEAGAGGRDQQGDEVDVLMHGRARGTLRGRVAHRRVVDVADEAGASHSHVSQSGGRVAEVEVQVGQQVQGQSLQHVEEFEHGGAEVRNQVGEQERVAERFALGLGADVPEAHQVLHDSVTRVLHLEGGEPRLTAARQVLPLLQDLVRVGVELLADSACTLDQVR